LVFLMLGVDCIECKRHEGRQRPLFYLYCTHSMVS
jgi:hypothetical protein